MTIHVELEPAGTEAVVFPDEFVPPTLDSLDSVLEQRRRFFASGEQRAQLVQVLLEEHQGQGAPPASQDNVRRLLEPNTFVVVAGQQPGLLTGPLYAPWKILSAIELAERLNRARQERFVPVFWNAGEDHDIAEMGHFVWLDRNGQPARFDCNPPDKDAPLPFGNRAAGQLDPQALFSFWDETLHPTEFFSPLKELVRQALESSANLGEFCNRILWQLFPDSGLVIFNSHAGRYPALVRSVLASEIQSPVRASQLVTLAGQQLRDRGYPPQVHKVAERCSFFLYEAGLRLPVYFHQNQFWTSRKTYSADDLERRLEEQPEDFSASAILRPIVQDALLPTAVSVLGPSERAYHLQLKSLYEAHGIPQPAVTSRWGLTLLTARVRRNLAKYGLTLLDLEEPLERLSRRAAAQESCPGFERLCTRLRSEIQTLMAELRQQALSLDNSLGPSIIGHEKDLLGTVDKIQGRLSAKLRQKNIQVEQAIARLKNLVYPMGEPQERCLNLFYFLNLFGLELLISLQDALASTQPGSAWQAWVEHESKGND